MRRLILALAVVIAGAGLARPALAHTELPPILRDVAFDQRLGAALPRDLAFRDERGRAVTLGQLLGGKPVVITLNEYECRNLCPLMLEGLAAGLHDTRLVLGRDYIVVSVSINPRETPAIAAARKRGIAGGYFTPGQRDGWRFLTGDQAAITALAGAVGFRYAYDAREGEYAHPTGVVVLTPAGTIARYLFGMDYPARDLRLALVEASSGRIGSLVDHALLFCYRYDAATGRYTPVVMTIVRIGGALTVVGMALMIGLLLRGERRRRAPRVDVERVGAADPVVDAERSAP